MEQARGVARQLVTDPARVDRRTLIAWLLFFGEDAGAVGINDVFSESEIDTVMEIAELMDERLTDCRQYYFENSPRYTVSPILIIGRTASGYLAGLWSYTVRD